LENGIFKSFCSEALKQKQKNFYIVIDEINRGNISKIFGELITLIEEDKRDVYEVTLPYSKDPFKVPSNLYIIATMNSTDKSIATIDIALRRRFTFLKMKPNAELIIFPHAKILFNNLNKFIKEKLGEDYQLGHSYFMKITKIEDLKFVKKYKIKPLLEEYFYADDENYKKAVDVLYSKIQEDSNE
jgi:5-methylcytosine-specific restriction protein B